MADLVEETDLQAEQLLQLLQLPTFLVEFFDLVTQLVNVCKRFVDHFQRDLLRPVEGSCPLLTLFEFNELLE